MRTPGATAQLILFYDGSVNVFDEITPEKAQVIMLMAARSATRVASYPLRRLPLDPQLAGSTVTRPPLRLQPAGSPVIRPPLHPQPAGSPVIRPPLRPQPTRPTVIRPPRPQGSQLGYSLMRPPHPQVGSSSTRPQHPQVGSPLMRLPCPQVGYSGATSPLLTQLLTRPSSITRLPSTQQNLGGGDNLRPHSLPLARAHSLKRFLEARQGRLVGKAPYDSRKKFDLNKTPDP